MVAPQHERVSDHAPRPLPLFLELLREVSERDPELAREALLGLRAYQAAPRRGRPPARKEVARVGGALLRDHGGDGPPAVLIPSLINPPRILDLDSDVSLADAVSRMGRRALLLDWGSAEQRSDLTVGGHIQQLLLPLLESIGGRPALIGYCLGGTMAIAAANFAPCERVVTLAAPWHFSQYPAESRAALQDMWAHSKGAAHSLGALPMEVLQAAFWSLDPERTVRKFAGFARLDPDSAEAARFVELEDWANEGDALPYPASTELIEDLFGRDLAGKGEWIVGGRPVTANLASPLLNILAEHDRIAPASTAPPGDSRGIATGHVGMVVGSAHLELRGLLQAFLAPCR